MKVKEVPFSWIPRSGHRLDVEPFVGGAVEARLVLESLKGEAQPLHAVTAGGMSGIVHAGRIKRQWVEDPQFGTPFLSSMDILRADLTHCSLISNKAVLSNPLLIIRKGWTLITRAGTVGRMAYSRPDMDGMACTEDVLRIVPDSAVIPSGYLFAFLNSKYGLPMVTSGTYGAIIQHIEPQHIADLPVPRLGNRTEGSAHELVEKAAALRTSAAKTLRDVGHQFDRLIADVDLKQRSPRTVSVPASIIAKRFDAQFHDPVVAQIRECLTQKRHTTIGQWCTRVFLPGIFKRIHVDDPSFGVPYYTGASLFWLEPVPKANLSRKTSLFDDVRLTNGTVLVQAFGQEGGLTGRALWVGKHLDGAATTHMLVRLEAASREKSAYLFGFLQSEAAYRQIASVTFGGSIPHFDEAGISQVVMPLLDKELVSKIVADVLAAVEARDEALVAERAARLEVESAIEEGA